MKYDIFISHAHEDRDAVARPLARELERRGLRVWYDETTLTIGDSLRRSVDHALADSRYGVVILSRHFIAKEWTNRELDGLVGRAGHDVKIILPVWHGVSRAEVTAYSATLADLIAVSTDYGIKYVADEICRVVNDDSDAIVVTTSDVHDPLSMIRTIVLSATGPKELVRCRYDIEGYLTEHPHNAEAKLLLDSILRALRYEESAHRASRWSLPPRFFIGGLVTLLVIAIIAFLLWTTTTDHPSPITVSPSTDAPPPPIDVPIPPTGRYSLQITDKDHLKFVLTWSESNDLDLSVQTPESALVWYRVPAPTPDLHLDRDVQMGPGRETITLSHPTPGAYRVTVRNYAGRCPILYGLSIVVNNTIQETLTGKLDCTRDDYTLHVLVRRR
jgi:TIR domain-containing protein